MKKKDEHIKIQKNIKSRQLIHDEEDKSTGFEKRAYLARFNNYIRQIIQFNSTPKVNLVGQGSTNSKLSLSENAGFLWKTVTSKIEMINELSKAMSLRNSLFSSSCCCMHYWASRMISKNLIMSWWHHGLITFYLHSGANLFSWGLLNDRAQ